MIAMMSSRTKIASATLGAAAALYSVYCSFWIFRWAFIAYRERQLGYRLVFVIGPEINAAILALVLGVMAFFAVFRQGTRNREQTVKTVSAYLVVVGLLAMGAWVCHPRREELRFQDEERSVMTGYANDLHAGMPKSEVEAYLASHSTKYLNENQPHGNLLVKIAEEPGDGFVCDRWFVYAQMEFDSEGPLLRVCTKKVGLCL